MFVGATVVGVAEKIKTYVSQNLGQPKNYLYDCNPNNPYKLPLPPQNVIQSDISWKTISSYTF